MGRIRVALVGVLAATALAAPAAHGATVVVKPSDMHDWVVQEIGSGTIGFPPGPGTPPLGTGSLGLKIGADTAALDQAQLRSLDYHGVRLADLTRLDYSSWVTQKSPTSCVAPFLLLSVDVDGDGDWQPDTSPDDLLFFEPCYQTGQYITDPPGQSIPNQCPLGGPQCFSLNHWDHWDAMVGGHWSALYGGAGGPPLTTLSEYIRRLNSLGYPNPKIANSSNCLGGLRMVAGFGGPEWANFDGNADALTVGVSGSDTTYDFENENAPIKGCPVAVSVDDQTVTEGNPPGTTPMTFHVSLGQAGNFPVTLNYHTEDVEATAPSDYASASGTLTFAPGETSKTVTVFVARDFVPEPTEHLKLVLTDVTNAAVAKDTGIGTILDDDRAGTFSCRATAVRVLGLELINANPQDSPCVDDDHAILKLATSGVLRVGANVARAVTNVTPDSPATTPPLPTDNATASAQTAGVLLVAGLNVITANVVNANAAVTCTGGVPHLAGDSIVTDLRVNGSFVKVAPGAPIDIPLILATLHINNTQTAPGRLTQRAIWVQTILGDVVVSEAKVDFTGNPCSVTSGGAR